MGLLGAFGGSLGALGGMSGGAANFWDQFAPHPTNVSTVTGPQLQPGTLAAPAAPHAPGVWGALIAEAQAKAAANAGQSNGGPAANGSIGGQGGLAAILARATHTPPSGLASAAASAAGIGNNLMSLSQAPPATASGAVLPAPTGPMASTQVQPAVGLQAPPAAAQTASGFAQMRAPDGTLYHVPQGQVQEATQNGMVMA
jgi:hypothetical protein